MNQSIIATNRLDDQLANSIWAMLGAPQKPESISDAAVRAEGGQINTTAQNETNTLPDLAAEILSKLEQKKETAAAHLGIPATEVETMPFDLTALEQAGIFLNIDATGFSVLSRQLDWQSLGIELPKEQTVHLSPPRTGLLPDDYRKPLQRAASRAHNALDRYSFRFALCEAVLGSSEYRWVPCAAFEAFEKEFAAALENLARVKAAVVRKLRGNSRNPARNFPATCDRFVNSIGVLAVKENAPYSVLREGYGRRAGGECYDWARKDKHRIFLNRAGEQRRSYSTKSCRPRSPRGLTPRAGFGRHPGFCECGESRVRFCRDADVGLGLLGFLFFGSMKSAAFRLALGVRLNSFSLNKRLKRIRREILS